jgi:outer membrane cobalamin receptor
MKQNIRTASALPLAITLAMGITAKAAENFSDLDLEALMEIPVSVASSQTLSIRETPGIVSVLTDKDIQNSGARDLTDLLRMISGVSFGAEVLQTKGIGFRGIWANEGKVLVKIDGQDWNELAYASFQVGDRLPVSLIERIEVIRGPGSVIHGGWAEVAVIDIHTKGHKEMADFYAAGAAGKLASGERGRSNGTLGASHSFSDNSGFSIWAYGGQMLLSDKTYTSQAGDSADLRHASTNKPLMINASGEWNHLSTRLIWERFSDQQITNYGDPSLAPIDIKFESLLGEIKYDIPVTSDWQITPSLKIDRQTPFNSKDPTGINTGAYLDKFYQRFTGSIIARHSMEGGSYASAGVEYKDDRAKVLSDPGNNNGKFYPNSNDPSPYFQMSSVAAFVETMFKTNFGNFSAGIRHEKPSILQSSTVPRFAWTKIWGDWHSKALVSYAYRAPSFENVSLNPDILPEHTRTLEFEVGRTLAQHNRLTLSLFHTVIKDPIIYQPVNGSDSYQNFAQTGSRGIEFEWAYRTENLTSAATWSISTAQGLNSVPLYDSGNPQANLGFSNHILAWNSSWQFEPEWRLSTIIQHRSPYRAFLPDATYTTTSAQDVDASTFALLAVKKENLLAPGVTATIGAANILNQNEATPFAYRSDNSTASSLPGRSRELFVRLEYSHDL